jgi:hypothetical protein
LESENETPLSKKLKEEQAHREEAANQDSAGQPESIDLGKETEERFRQYLSDPEPFPVSMRPEAFHGF